jgi:Trk-type K+ transport system membrane component
MAYINFKAPKSLTMNKTLYRLYKTLQAKLLHPVALALTVIAALVLSVVLNTMFVYYGWNEGVTNAVPGYTRSISFRSAFFMVLFIMVLFH